MRPAIRRKKVKVFIADDSLKVVERLTDLIGHAVDGPAAAESVLKLNPDVVILAFRMPKGNGIDVLKAIKITRPGTKVIIFTNFPYAQYRKKCLDAGADFFLDKSSEFNQIPGIILNLFQARS